MSSHRTTFATLRTIAEEERATLRTNARLSEEGKRHAFTHALTPWLRDAREALAEVRATRATRSRALDAARAEARAALPVPSEAMLLGLAAAARQDADFRAHLTAVVRAGGAASPEDRALVLALAHAPHAALFGLPEDDRRAAVARVAALAEDAPAVTRLAEEVERLDGDLAAMERTLRGLEPELDREALVAAGVLARGPEELPPAEREAWSAREPLGFALALADGPDAFHWTDPRESAPVLN